MLPARDVCSLARAPGEGAFAARDYCEAIWWSIELPEGWSVRDDPECATGKFGNPRPLGALGNAVRQWYSQAPGQFLPEVRNFNHGEAASGSTAVQPAIFGGSLSGVSAVPGGSRSTSRGRAERNVGGVSLCRVLVAYSRPRLSARRSGFLLLAHPPEQRAEFARLARLMELMMLFLDPPEHPRLRKLMNKGFAPAAVESLRPNIEAIVERLFEPLAGKSEFDIIHDIAYPLPVRVISEMLGIPEHLHQKFIRWSDDIAVFIGNIHRTSEQTRAAQVAAIAMTDFFREAVTKRRRQKSDDLISLLIDIEADGEVLTEEELYAQCVMLLLGGHETRRNLIGNGMYTLLQNAEAMAQLQDEPEIIRTAVEELLRFESPIQYTGRIVRQEMELDGAQVRPGELLLFMLGAANRDPRQFNDADRMDLKRLNNSHLAFGAGAHFCIGNQLARLEGAGSDLTAGAGVSAHETDFAAGQSGLRTSTFAGCGRCQ